MLKKKTLIISFLVFLILDQLSKIAARNYLSEDQNIWIWPEHIKLTLAYNSGAFLSLGAGWSETARTLVFIIFVMGFLLFLWKLISSPNNTLLQDHCYTLILSGGVGNLIDRILFRKVTDFLWMGFGPLQTGIFNIADMAILFGVLFLLGEDLISRQKKAKKD